MSTDLDFQPPSQLADAALLARPELCQRVRARLDSYEAAVLAEIERRRAYVGSGAVDATAWLKQATGVSGREAKRATRLAEGLAALPATALALAEGTITTDHAQTLARVVTDLESDRGHHAEAVRTDETMLLAQAKQASADEFGRTVRRFCDSVDRDDGLSRHERARARRQVSLRPADATGLGRISAELHPEAYAIVSNTIGNVADELWRADGGRSTGREAQTIKGRTLRQRQADALVEICRRAGNVGPEAGRQARPTIVVTMSHDRLVDQLRSHRDQLDPDSTEANRLGQVLDGDGPVPAAMARRLACEAEIISAVLGTRSEPLDVGRANRLPTRAQRRALVLRDGQCRFPGCDRPHHWCEAHHLHTWLEGGPTDLDNLVLLCTQHHHAVHEGGWSLTGTPDTLDARPRPENTQHQSRAGPRSRAA